MSPTLLVGPVLGVVLIVTSVVMGATRKRPTIASDEVDPLSIVAVAVSGGGAAVTATLGPAVMGMMVTRCVHRVGGRRLRRSR